MVDCTALALALKLCTVEPDDKPLPYTAEQSECLSKEAARRKWPTAHLYWHTPNRCWDDQPGRRRYTAPRALAKADDEPMRSRKPLMKSVPSRESKPLTVSDASGNAADRRRARMEIIYPALIQEQAAIAADALTMRRPITEWPLLLDLDALGPDPNRGIDACCWPNLQILLMEQTK